MGLENRAVISLNILYHSEALEGKKKSILLSKPSATITTQLHQNTLSQTHTVLMSNYINMQYQSLVGI